MTWTRDVRGNPKGMSDRCGNFYQDFITIKLTTLYVTINSSDLPSFHHTVRLQILFSQVPCPLTVMFPDPTLRHGPDKLFFVLSVSPTTSHSLPLSSSFIIDSPYKTLHPRTVNENHFNPTYCRVTLLGSSLH